MPADPRYAEWITAYKAQHAWKNVIGGDGPGGMNGTMKGLCGGATAAMVKAFPELRRVPGYVYVTVQEAGPFYPPGPQEVPAGEHWWCETPDGEVVDPTACQFAHLGGPLRYVEETDPPIGKCPNCGDLYGEEARKYGGVCSKECFSEFAAYLNGEAHAR